MCSLQRNVTHTPETRTDCAGVQKDRTRKGELWGLENLLQLTEGIVRTQTLVNNPATEDVEFRVEEFDAGSLHCADARTCAGQGSLCPMHGCSLSPSAILACPAGQAHVHCA